MWRSPRQFISPRPRRYENSPRARRDEPFHAGYCPLPALPYGFISPCTPALSAAPALLCLSNCPDRASATRIARDLVERRLAACVNLLPGVESVYRWQGAVETGSEVMLLIKTTPRHLEAVTARIVALHPYELPEVIALESAGGLAGYLEWITSETSGDQPA